MALKTGLATAAPHEKIDGYFGIDVEAQRRIGTFVVMCSMLEMQVERVAICLKGQLEPGERIWTDGKVISDLIAEATKLLGRIPQEEVREVVRLALGVAGDLLAIRHTVVHGVPIGATAESKAVLARNKSWFGEVRRREQSQVAADGEVLNHAATIADLLFRVLGCSMSALGGHWPVDLLLRETDNLRAAAARAAEMKKQALVPRTDRSGA